MFYVGYIYIYINCQKFNLVLERTGTLFVWWLVIFHSLLRLTEPVVQVHLLQSYVVRNIELT